MKRYVVEYQAEGIMWQREYDDWKDFSALVESSKTNPSVYMWVFDHDKGEMAFFHARERRIEHVV